MNLECARCGKDRGSITSSIPTAHLLLLPAAAGLRQTRVRSRPVPNAEREIPCTLVDGIILEAIIFETVKHQNGGGGGGGGEWPR